MEAQADNPNNDGQLLVEISAANENEIDLDDPALTDEKPQPEETDHQADILINLEQEEPLKEYYLQKYKPEWETLPEFMGWLEPTPGDMYKARCSLCGVDLRCHKLKLRQHANSKKHEAAMAEERRGHHRPRPYVTSRAPRRSLGRRVAGRPRKAPPPPRRPNPWDKKDSDAGTPSVSYNDAGRVTYAIGLGGSKVGFIGAGTIAQAIAQAILDKGVINPSRLMASSPSSRHLAVWTGWGAAVSNSNDVVVQLSDLVFVCLPPAAAVAALHALAPATGLGERCFVSVVPGLSRQQLETILTAKYAPPESPSDSVHVIRCMVNLAVRTGTGCCAYSIPAALPDRWLLCLEVVCGSLGVSHALPDGQLEPFAAAFGSGPALALVFAESLALGAASLGLPWTVARKMAAQTMIGAGRLMLDEVDNKRPVRLLDEAAPPGGATLAALVALQQTDVRSGVVGAVQASLKALRESQ